MKKLLLFILLSCAPVAYLFADTYVMFWTSNKNYGKIKVYHNGSYAGTITRAYSSAPSCGTAGCVTVRISGTGNTWRAEAEDGTTWSSSARTYQSNTCNTIRLYGTPTGGGGYSQSYSSGSGNAGGNSTGSKYVPGGTDDGTFGAVLIIAAAVGVTFLANDVYVSGVTSREYSGFNLGLRNTLDPHIDIETGVGGFFRAQNKLMPKSMATRYNFDRRDPYYEEMSKGTWTFDFNILYNVRERDRDPRFSPIWNAFFGVGTSTILNPGYDFHKGAFSVGPMVGLSFGKGVKLELRYKILWNPVYEKQLFNQIELGFSVKYKKGLRFKD